MVLMPLLLRPDKPKQHQGEAASGLGEAEALCEVP